MSSGQASKSSEEQTQATPPVVAETANVEKKKNRRGRGSSNAKAERNLHKMNDRVIEANRARIRALGAPDDMLDISVDLMRDVNMTEATDSFYPLEKLTLSFEALDDIVDETVVQLAARNVILQAPEVDALKVVSNYQIATKLCESRIKTRQASAMPAEFMSVKTLARENVAPVATYINAIGPIMYEGKMFAPSNDHRIPALGGGAIFAVPINGVDVNILIPDEIVNDATEIVEGQRILRAVFRNNPLSLLTLGGVPRNVVFGAVNAGPGFQANLSLYQSVLAKVDRKLSHAVRPILYEGPGHLTQLVNQLPMPTGTRAEVWSPIPADTAILRLGSIFKLGTTAQPGFMSFRFVQNDVVTEGALATYTAKLLKHSG